LENAMKIDNAVVLVTGANRGIGLAFASRVARPRRPQGLRRRTRPRHPHPAGVHALRLDVNNPDDVAAAAALART
jgi:NAD(P)-dependent dehydrogenase (short-subunit alcohol dehydrogenase family)